MKLPWLAFAFLPVFFFTGCNDPQNYISWNPRHETFEMDSSGTSRENINLLREAGTTGVYGCRVAFGDDKVNLEITGPEAGIYFTPEAAGLPESWKDFNSLLVKIDSGHKDSVRLKISYIGDKNKIVRESLLKSATSVIFDLSEIPLAGRPNTMFEPRLISFEFLSVGTGMKITIEDVLLKKMPREEQPPVVDSFGQRRSVGWNGKIAQNNDMQAGLEKELAELNKKIALTGHRDSYGGMITGVSYPSKGYFSIARDKDENYFFVTPEGNPFWSLGVTGVRPSLKGTDGTTVSGREYLFEYIPDREGEFSEVWTDSSAMSFYYLNILKKYGNLNSWIEMLFKRFDNWGINTIGNWSDERVLEGCEIPFTYSFRTTLNPEFSLGSGLSDVFNPGWEAYTDSVFEGASEYKNNPFLLGYFVDNEAGWGDARLLERLDGSSPGREAWVKLLKEKYSSLEELNQAWESSWSDWSEVKEMKENEGNDSFSEDYDRLEALFAMKYFSTVSQILRKHDPNHLYLGCRFTRALKPDHILKAAGKYCDVTTVNVYSLVPEQEQMTEWFQKTGKPVLIGEHHLPLVNNKQFPPLYPAFTEAERSKFYKEYVKSWAEMPFSLGCHWYQLVDQHITGRPSNGENQIVGLVDITDQPYEHMIEAIKWVSDSIYGWHLNSE